MPLSATGEALNGVSEAKPEKLSVNDDGPAAACQVAELVKKLMAPSAIAAANQQIIVALAITGILDLDISSALKELSFNTLRISSSDDSMWALLNRQFFVGMVKNCICGSQPSARILRGKRRYASFIRL